MSVRLKQVKFEEKLARLWLLTEDIVTERTNGERDLSSFKITYMDLVSLKYFLLNLLYD